MARIVRGPPKRWLNYHETVDQQVSRLQIVGLDPADTPVERLVTAARLVQGELANGRDLRPLGAAWSLSPLQASAGDLLATFELGQVYPLPRDAFAAGTALPVERQRLVMGGTRIKELNFALEGQGLSLRTSGASNGQSVAGAIATGTHGSVPGFGAFQDHVRGIHLVTGAGRSVWLESAALPALDDGFARGFADELVRDDALFQAALVHLGGLGYVNAVLFEAAPRFLLGIVQRKKVLPRDAIEQLARGDFAGFAARFNYPEPYFVQVILNPFRPYTRAALVRLLIPRPEPLLELRTALFEGLVDFDPLNLLADVIDLLPPGGRGELIAILMRRLYPEQPKRDVMPPGVPWSATTPDHRRHGDLFSTGIAIERARLPEALDAMVAAFRRDDGGDTVLTLRFVQRSGGTLAFTRFADNVVIDLDGLRSPASARAYQRVLSALDDARIPSRQHWGKLSRLSAGRVVRDHGEAVARWKAARAELLSLAMAASFRSRALVDWGLA